MSGCCEPQDDGLTHPAQVRVLWAVLTINAIMFVAEFAAGWLADSTALLADSLDMLGDALVYGFSLFVVARSLRWKALAAGLKGGIMLVFGVIVLVEAVSTIFVGGRPDSTVMALMGLVALAANTGCLVLLTRRRGDDVNMRSAWVCSRNDLLANGGTVAAAAAVAVWGSFWPDVVVGLAIAALFLRSALGVLADAGASHRAAQQGEVVPGAGR